MTINQKGWGFPGQARKAHYFEKGLSLCRKWMYAGPLDNDRSEVKGPDDCAQCRRTFDARTIVEAPTNG